MLYFHFSNIAVYLVSEGSSLDIVREVAFISTDGIKWTAEASYLSLYSTDMYI